MKNVLMCISIFLLIALLLLPPGLRMFGKDLYPQKENIKKKDEVYVLNCTSLNETINMSYVNSKPYNLQYLIKGNYVTYSENDNHIINDIVYYSEITYNSVDNTTEYRISFNKLDSIPEKLLNYSKNFEEQKTYYSGFGFNCTKVSYE